MSGGALLLRDVVDLVQAFAILGLGVWAIVHLERHKREDREREERDQ